MIYSNPIPKTDNVREVDKWRLKVVQFLLNVAAKSVGINGLVWWGTGSPNGSVTAIVGALYLRLDGGANTTLYVKESGTGNTGWVAK
jgi:hypothetical protein